MQLKIRLC